MRRAKVSRCLFHNTSPVRLSNRASVDLVGARWPAIIVIIVSESTIIAAAVIDITVIAPGRSAISVILIPPWASVGSAGDERTALGHAWSRIAEDSVGAWNSAPLDEELDASPGNAIDDAGRVGYPAEPALSRTRHQILSLGVRCRTKQRTADDHRCRQYRTKHVVLHNECTNVPLS